MSEARRIRRKQQREGQNHQAMLGALLGDFYEFLSKQPQPTDEEVRATFTSSDNKWKRYCKFHQLMNADHLFVLNVQEAWKRHTKLPKNGQSTMK